MLADCHNKPVSQVPTPHIPEPPLPAPTLPPCIIVCHDTHGPWYGCWHTCSSGEDCKHDKDGNWAPSLGTSSFIPSIPMFSFSLPCSLNPEVSRLSQWKGRIGEEIQPREKGSV